MALYEMTQSEFREISPASFTQLQVRERTDLQRLLRSQIDVISDDLYVITEEFGEWEDSRRRIDLLAIDKQANLVVIELKRTQDGGHMELQAIRYASMVSAMTFDRAVDIHAAFLARMGENGSEAESRLLDFLQWEEAGEEDFAPDVKIILVSEDFGIELTTAVLWLRERDIDIRCIRLKPYSEDDRCFVDVQQIIPLPEASSYIVKIKEKEKAERKHKAERYDIRLKFWQGVVAEAQLQNGRHANIKPGIYNWIGSGSGIRGLGFNLAVAKDSSQAELYIDRGNKEENKKIFDELLSERSNIDAAFGEKLIWERLDAKRASRIKWTINEGGYRSPENIWPDIHREMVQRMKQLEEALRPAMDKLEL